jgi:cell wall-active antibiotic response 4TMS protein YvqF/uncharacterized protein DUF2154
MRRSSLFWGVILLLLGLLMLGDAYGLRLPGGARPMEFFWPVLLILIGAWILLGVLTRPRVVSEHGSVDLQGASEAELRIDHGAGELRISGGAEPGKLAAGTFSGGMEQSAQMEGSRLVARMRPPQPTFMVMPQFERHDWDVRLSNSVPILLTLHTGANNAVVNLAGMRITGLRVETGASETEVTLPAEGRFRADFSLGAASLRVSVPQGMAARVRVSQGVSDVKVDQARFPRMGDAYQSPDFDSAANAVDLKIDAGAAEIRVQ